MFDDRLAQVETVSAELSVTQPREISLYAKVFQELSTLARYGPQAREMIRKSLDNLQQQSVASNDP